MGETLVTITAIFLVAILMFVFPLLSVSERSDDISQLNIQTATSQFVDNVRLTGKITPTDYSNFVQTLGATGNTFNIDMEAKVLDDNPGSKPGGSGKDKIGENVSYSTYTSQIEDVLNNGNDYKLKEGDIISVNVKNTNTTISQTLRNFFYRLTGNSDATIVASSSGMVTVTGK